MDLQCFHSRSRLKIRRAPSCSSSQISSSFHGTCCRQMKKKGCNSNNVRQPLIFHTFEPETIVTEPAEFMSVVQRLTGSAHTRRLQRTSIRKSKEMQLLVRIPDVQLMQQGMQLMQKDPLKEGSTIILAPTSFSKIGLPPSPSCPNPNDSIKHAPDLAPLSHANPPLLSHANPPLSSHTNPPLSPASSDLSNSSCLSSATNHPSSSLSSNSVVSEGAIMNMSKEAMSQLLLPSSPHNPRTPFSSSFLHDMKKLEPSLPSTLIKPNKCKPLIIDNNQEFPLSPNFSNCGHSVPSLPAKASDELGNRRRGPPPVSPNSSLTTSTSSEDNLSAEGGASPCREAFSYLDDEDEEDGSTHFFVFSGDSYYGSFNDAAQDLDFQYISNALDSMPLDTPSSFFKDNILLED